MTLGPKVQLYTKNGNPKKYEGLRRTSSGQINVGIIIPNLTIRKVVATGKGKGKTVMNKPITSASDKEEFVYAGVAVKYLIDMEWFDLAKDKIKKIRFGKFQDIFFQTWKTNHFLNFLRHFLSTDKQFKNTFKGLQRSSLIDLVVNYSKA
jgi:hypothetical protein